MSISPLALQAKKVIEAAWLNGPSYDLASQAAFALESAQLLQSPELVTELSERSFAAAEAAVAELKREHEENERLRARVTELEAELYTEQAQHRTTLEQRNAHAQELLALRGGRATPYTATAEAHAQMREGLTRYFAGQPALEDPHDSPLHHSYRLGRDLP